MIPEGACPGSDGGVEEDVAAEVLANVAFEADDSFGVFVSGVAGVRTDGTELCGDAVKLEEAEVTVVLGQIIGCVEEGLIVSGIGELHASASFSVPVGATIVAAGAVATDRTEPCADACTHFCCGSSDVTHFVGEAGVEGPETVVVPSVVDDEAVGTDAVAVEEVGFPVSEHVEHLVSRHVLSRVSRVVAVDVEFIPRDIGGVGTPRHGTFAFAVGKEGATLLRLVDVFFALASVLSHETHHGRNLPIFAGGKRRVAAPASLDVHEVGVHDHSCFGRVDGSGDFAGGIHALRFLLNEETQGVGAVVGHDDAEGVVLFGSAGVACVIVAGSHVAVGVNQVGAAQVQTVVTALVEHGGFHLLVLLQRQVLDLIVEHVGIAGAGGFGDAGRHVSFGHFHPAGGSQRLLLDRSCLFPLVFVARCAAHGVVAHGVLESGENLVAHQNGTAGVAHHFRCGACGFRVHGVNHWNDVKHVHAGVAGQFHFGAEIVAAVAEHCFPNDVQHAFLIIIGIVCHECFAVEVFSTAHSVFTACEVFEGETLECHGGSGHCETRTDSHGEGFGAGFKVHGFGTAEEESIANLDEGSGEDVVLQREDTIGFRGDGCADCILLSGIDNRIGIDSLLSLHGNVGVGEGHRFGEVVDGEHSKLAFLNRHDDIALLERSIHGAGLAVGVGVSVNGDCHALGENHRVFVGSQIDFGEGPTATGVGAARILPDAKGDRAVNRVLITHAIEPVQIFSGNAGTVVGLDIVIFVGVVFNVEISTLRLFVGEGDEAGLVGVTGGFFIAQPLVVLVAVDVVGVFHPIHSIERKVAVVVGCLRGRGERSGIVVVATQHRVEMLRLSIPSGERGGSLNDVCTCLQGHSQEQQHQGEQFSHTH